MTLQDLQRQISALPTEVRHSPERLFTAVLDLYEQHRIDGTTVENDGDMLLFQWGAYDWGRGEHFELDLTRQAILPLNDSEQDPRIPQLRCTFRYDPAGFDSIQAGNRWCLAPGELPEFRTFVLGSEAMAAALKHAPVSVTVEIEDAE